MESKLSPAVSSIRFERGDRLLIRRYSLEGLASEAFHATFLHDDGRITRQIETLGFLAADTSGSSYIQLDAGYLLDLSITPNADLPTGRAYYEFSRINGKIDSPETKHTFFSGYAQRPGVLAYPHNPSRTPGEVSPPTKQIIPTSTPGGADISLVDFLVGQTELFALSCIFTASATVANRAITFLIRAGSEEVIRLPPRTNVTAGQTRRISLVDIADLPADNATDHFYCLPRLGSLNNLTVETVTSGLQAGDAFSQLVVWARRRMHDESLA